MVFVPGPEQSLLVSNRINRKVNFNKKDFTKKKIYSKYK